MAGRIPIITEADVHAVRNVLAGQGTATDQKKAMQFIGEQLCRRFDSPYEPSLSDTDLGFELGRHWVGVMLSNMLMPATLEKARADDAERAKVPTIAAPRAAPKVNRRRPT